MLAQPLSRMPDNGFHMQQRLRAQHHAILACEGLEWLCEQCMHGRHKLHPWGVTAVEQLCLVQELEVGHRPGINRLCLRLPTVVTHAIGPDSPLAHWDEPSGILQDADSEIVVVVSPRHPAVVQKEHMMWSLSSAFASEC